MAEQQTVMGSAGIVNVGNILNPNIYTSGEAPLSGERISSAQRSNLRSLVKSIAKDEQGKIALFSTLKNYMGVPLGEIPIEKYKDAHDFLIERQRDVRQARSQEQSPANDDTDEDAEGPFSYEDGQELAKVLRDDIKVAHSNMANSIHERIESAHSNISDSIHERMESVHRDIVNLLRAEIAKPMVASNVYKPRFPTWLVSTVVGVTALVAGASGVTGLLGTSNNQTGCSSEGKSYQVGSTLPIQGKVVACKKIANLPAGWSEVQSPVEPVVVQKPKKTVRKYHSKLDEDQPVDG